MAEYTGPDIICIVTGQPNSVLHHVKTRGAGGPDKPENLLPICQAIHVEVHAKGLTWAANRYPQIKRWLEGHQWKFCHFLNRWVNYTEV